jgi:hypothetical protein
LDGRLAAGKVDYLESSLVVAMESYWAFLMDREMEILSETTKAMPLEMGLGKESGVSKVDWKVDLKALAAKGNDT